MRQPKLQAKGFVIDTRPVGVWGYDIDEQNDRAIRGLNPEFFSYQADLHFKRITSEQSDPSDEEKHASTALRILYSHAQECFFAMLMTAIQAPHCVQGWLLNYRLEELRSLVDKVARGAKVLSFIATERVSWETLALAFQPLAETDEELRKLNQEGFAAAWSQFAREFLDEEMIAEYNSLKHGMRGSFGPGFTMTVGLQKDPRTPAPVEAMRSMGGSNFGGTYWSQRRLQWKDHFVIEKNSHNWISENYYHGIHLLSLSMKNIRTQLLVRSKPPLNKKKEALGTAYLFEAEHFRLPWAKTPGVIRSGRWGYRLDDSLTREITEKEILEIYKKPPVDDRHVG